MIPHKLNGKLLFLALLGVILYFTSNMILVLSNNDALEEDLGAPAVTKAEAGDTALRFAQDRLGLKGTGTEVTYQSDKYASGYVARNQLKKAYEENFSHKALLDYWLVNVEDAGNGQSVMVRVGMDHPDITGWEKSAALPKNHDDKGLPAAMKALKEFGYNPDDWVSSKEIPQKANQFVFTSAKEKLGDAPMTVTIGVKNGEAVSLKTGFQVPESYMGFIKPQERLAGWMTGGSLALSAALGITAIVFAIIYGRQISWARGIFLSLVVLVLYILSNLNMTDAMLSAQGANGNEKAAAIFITVFVILFALITAASVWFSLLAGDQQWRMKGWNPWPRWRDPEFGEEVFYGMGRGYLICFFILGVQQVLFLIAGNVFDTFAISDPTQSVYNMKWPWLFPTLAWVAAIMEEAVYRLFGVALFKRLLRFDFLAVLVPGIIWALGHTGYTIYPSYTRLFEVAVLGLIFGYTFLKFGLITAIFAHVSMDLLLMSIALMAGEPTGFNIALGISYILMPAVIGYVIRSLHPRFGRGRGRVYPPNPEPRLTP